MPKMKTRRATAKRFRPTGGGHFKRARAFKSHILAKKNRKRKRRLASGTVVHESNQYAVERQLPYL